MNEEYNCERDKIIEKYLIDNVFTPTFDTCLELARLDLKYFPERLLLTKEKLESIPQTTIEVYIDIYARGIAMGIIKSVNNS